MADDDVFDELAALAGGEDSSDDEAAAPSGNKSPASSVGSYQPAAAKSPSPTPNDKPDRKSPKARKSTSGRRGRRNSDDDAAGSSAGSDAGSLGSRAMDESDSDTTPVDVDDGVAFPLEGKFRDEKDRKMIMAMTEIEREQILADRMQEQEHKVFQNQLLRRRLQDQKAEEKKKSKRKADSANLDDSPRKATKPKTQQAVALEELKRARNDRAQGRRTGADRTSTAKDRRGSDSSADADGDEDVEWDDGQRTFTSKQVEPAEQRHYEHTRIGRTNFARLCFYPGFEDVFTGCYARVSIGIDKRTGTNTYRMCRINRFAEGKPYPLEGKNGKTFMTNQYAVLAHGKAEKEWPFMTCSDSKFTEAEYNRYITTCGEDRVKLPSKAYLVDKLDKIHKLVHRTWTDAEIEEKLRRSGAIQARMTGFERDRIQRERKAAIGRGDADAVARYDTELAALESPLAKAKSIAAVNASDNSNGATKELSQGERLAVLNAANRKKNSEDIRKALIAEKRSQAEARAAAHRAKLEKERLEAALAAQKEVEAAEKAKLGVPADGDLFGDASDLSRAATPASGIATPRKNANGKHLSRSGTPLGANRKGLPGISTIRGKTMDDELAGLDIEIDVDV